MGSRSAGAGATAAPPRGHRFRALQHAADRVDQALLRQHEDRGAHEGDRGDQRRQEPGIDTGHTYGLNHESLSLRQHDDHGASIADADKRRAMTRLIPSAVCRSRSPAASRLSLPPSSSGTVSPTWGTETVWASFNP